MSRVSHEKKQRQNTQKYCNPKEVFWNKVEEEREEEVIQVVRNWEA